MSTSVPAADPAPLPSPPFIDVEGIPNFRDLGGYATPSGKSIKRGIVYRCGVPSNVTPEGVKTLQELKIGSAYDLRSTPEIEWTRTSGGGDIAQWEGCERVFVPVFKDEDYSPEGMALRYKSYFTKGTEGFRVAYTQILANAPPAYKKILLHLAHEPQKPLIVHCTAGKDRTGVFCALLLSLCGVDDETIAKEYELTEIGLSRKWKEGVVAHLMQNPSMEGNVEGAWNLTSSKSENMLAFLKSMKSDVGSAENYMIEKCGLSEEEVDKIRRNLIVADPAVLKKVPQVL